MNKTENKTAQDPPNHPHDKLFKVVFKRPTYAREVLEGRFPEGLLAHLDLGTLRPSDSNRVDPNLEEDFTDVQLVCDSKEGHRVEIPILLEHKSYKPQYPPYQYMHYQDGVWGWQVQAEGVKPTPIVIVVFYHGKTAWEPRPWKSYLEGWDEVFAPFTPPGGCIFISLSDFTDEDIKNFRYGFLKAALLLMKHRFERDYLLENLYEIFNFVEADPAESNIENRIENLKYALRYLQGLQNIKWKEAKEKLKPLKFSYQAMDVYEEIKIESFQEGIEEGIKKGLEKGLQEGIEKGLQEGIEKGLQEGIEKGLQEGIEKGIEKGLEKGIEKEKFVATRNMLRKNFDKETIQGVLECTGEYVLNVQKQLEKEILVTVLLQSGKVEDADIAAQLEVPIFLVEAVKKELDRQSPKSNGESAMK